jgi:hypothetical protein
MSATCYARPPRKRGRTQLSSRIIKAASAPRAMQLSNAGPLNIRAALNPRPRPGPARHLPTFPPGGNASKDTAKASCARMSRSISPLEVTARCPTKMDALVSRNGRLSLLRESAFRLPRDDERSDAGAVNLRRTNHSNPHCKPRLIETSMDRIPSFTRDSFLLASRALCGNHRSPRA